MPSMAELRKRRLQLLRTWDRYLGTGRAERNAREDEEPPCGLRTEIVASWERSADQGPPRVDAAPLADPDETLTTWEESPLPLPSSGSSRSCAGRPSTAIWSWR
jgi:hypothetical protein